MIWNGDLHYNHDSHTVRLRNISATGALVEGAGHIPAGAELLLDLGNDVTIFATLLWLRGDEAGLLFESPFAIERLAESRPTIAPSEWQAPSFLGSAQAGASDPWNRASLADLRDTLEGFMKR